MKTQQQQQLKIWLLKIDMAGKKKRLTNEQYDFITKYLNAYWKKNIKGINEKHEYVNHLPCSLRRKVIFK